MVETTTTKNMKWRREKYKKNWITLKYVRIQHSTIPSLQRYKEYSITIKKIAIKR